MRALHESMKPHGCVVRDFKASWAVELRRHIKAVYVWEKKTTPKCQQRNKETSQSIFNTQIYLELKLNINDHFEISDYPQHLNKIFNNVKQRLRKMITMIMIKMFHDQNVYVNLLPLQRNQLNINKIRCYPMCITAMFFGCQRWYIVWKRIVKFRTSIVYFIRKFILKYPSKLFLESLFQLRIF